MAGHLGIKGVIRVKIYGSSTTKRPASTCIHWY